jgi:subtilisin family serine protease
MLRRTRVGFETGILVLIVLLGLPAGGAFPASAATPARPAPQFVDGRVLVGFRPGTSRATATATIKNAGGVPGTVIGLGTHVVTVGHGKVQSTVAALRHNPNVRYAEPDFIYHVTATPNDPSFGQLWAMSNTGQTVNGTSGTAGADIHATQAWSFTTGSASVVVADVDTGLDYTHPDLAPNVWSNPGGIGGCPAGTHGYNAIAGSCDPMDDNNHGSHTAGTIGAAGNNGIGVTGVNWTTSIIGVKAFDASGNTTSTSIVQSLQWVLDAKNAGVNVRVINASWGGWDSSQATSDLIAALGADNVLFVAAAGNFGLPHSLIPFYPCDYAVATIICVGASDQTDSLAYFSDYGAASVDLAAPGTNILSTVRGGGYAYLDGTSMATPHVTGAVALVDSLGDFSAAQVKADILNGVDVLPSLSGLVGTSGRLDLAKTLTLAGAPTAPGAPVLSGTAGDSAADLSWTSTAPGDSPITGYRVYRGSVSGGETLLAEVPISLAYHDAGLTNGTTYYYAVSAVSAIGEGPRSNEIAVTPAPPPTVPDAPTLTGAAGTGSAMLCWSVPANGGSPITGYRLQRTGDGSLTSLPLGVTTSYSDSPLTDGVTYSYQVSAINLVGEGPASPAVAITPPGTAPTLGGFSPSIANGGTTITVTGTGLGMPGCGTTVLFGTQPGTIVAGSDTGLSVLSPSQGGSGRITVSNPSGTATSTTDFYAVPAGTAPAAVAVTGRLTAGTVTSLTLASGQLAMFLFDGTAGSSVSLNMTSVTVTSSDVTILNPDGTTFGRFSALGTGGGFIDAKALPQTGTYAVIFDPRSTYSGSAKLTLYLVPPDVTGTLTPGTALTVSIGTPGQNARLTFAGTSGSIVSLNMTSVTITSSDVTILNPDGTTFGTFSALGTGGGFIDAKALSQTGTYSVVFNPRGANTGSARLTLYVVPPDVTGTLTPGTALTVSIGTPGQNARLTFAGTAGSVVSLNVTAVTITSTDVTVLRPDGTTLATFSALGTGGGFIDAKALTQTGTYTVLFNPRGASTGTAKLTLYLVPPDVTGTLTPGTDLTVSIGTPGQNARLTFAGTAGSSVSLNMTSVTISSSDVTILAPDGSTFGTFSALGTGGGFIDAKALTQTGTYTVLFNPRSANTGSAQLTLYLVPPDITASLTPGTPLTVSIGTPGQNARLTFAGTAGSSVSLNMSTVTIGSSDVTILAPDGTTKVASLSAMGTTGGTLKFTASVSGTYTVILNPRGANIGSVKLTLTSS